LFLDYVCSKYKAGKYNWAMKLRQVPWSNLSNKSKLSNFKFIWYTWWYLEIWVLTMYTKLLKCNATLAHTKVILILEIWFLNLKIDKIWRFKISYRILFLNCGCLAPHPIIFNINCIQHLQASTRLHLSSTEPWNYVGTLVLNELSEGFTFLCYCMWYWCGCWGHWIECTVA